MRTAAPTVALVEGEDNNRAPRSHKRNMINGERKRKRPAERGWRRREKPAEGEFRPADCRYLRNERRKLFLSTLSADAGVAHQE